MRIRLCLIVTLALLVLLPQTLRAWHHEGHHLIVTVAVQSLPADVPTFFREGGAAIAHCSVDPDVFREKTTPQLKSTESAEHFIDLEMLDGHELPPLRQKYVALCAELKIDPFDAGMLPWSVTEWQQKLTVAFAEHRRWPDDPFIRSKCLIYAGILGHYSGDLSQPLHCTIHHNGRVTATNKNPHGTIHAKVDDLLYRLTPQEMALPADGKIEPLKDVFAAVVDEIRATNKLVDGVYAMEKKLPGVKEKIDLDPEVKKWAVERSQAGVRLTAQLVLTAWRDSEKVKLADWLDRAAMDKPAGAK